MGAADTGTSVPGRRVLAVESWDVPTEDAGGYDPRSAYVETFFTPIVGPSAILAVRRLAALLEHWPQGFSIDLESLGASLGLGTRTGRHAPAVRTLERLVRYGLARWQPNGALAVRRRLGPLPPRLVRRLAPGLQRAHEQVLACRGASKAAGAVMVRDGEAP